MKRIYFQPKPWLLNALSNGDDFKRSLISLVAGLVGIIAFALFNCAALGAILLFSQMRMDSRLQEALFGIGGFLVLVACYTSLALAIQVIVACDLPLAVRLGILYVLVFAAGFLASTGQASTQDKLSTVLLLLPLGLGGFFMRRGGWRAFAWRQSPSETRISISSLMDVTAAIALTLAVVNLTGAKVLGLGCYVITALMLAVMGLHLWVRLMEICPVLHRGETGRGVWLSLNIAIAFFVFVGFTTSFSSTPVALVGFIAAPSTVVVAHYGTLIPLRWLSGLGWTMVRLDEREPLA
ncbi:MAG: hypothetical protein AB8B91_07250 [Rubripirellula sp.]